MHMRSAQWAPVRLVPARLLKTNANGGPGGCYLHDPWDGAVIGEESLNR